MNARIFVLAFSLFFCFENAGAQYLPLAVENAHWKVHQDDASTPWEDFKYEYLLRGDTIWEGKEYKKIWFRHFLYVEDSWPGYYVMPYQIDSQYFFAGIREDTSLGKVFAFFPEDGWSSLPDCPFGEEFLLYDWSVEKGDTAHWCMLDGPTVVNETVYANYPGADATLRKLIYLEAEVWEGIGSEKGLFNIPLHAVSGFYSNLYDYCIGTDEECGITVATDREVLPLSIRIYPNPASTLCRIEARHILRIDLFDMLGRPLQRIVDPADGYLLDLRHFPSGLLWLRLQDEQGREFWKKLMKE